MADVDDDFWAQEARTEVLLTRELTHNCWVGKKERLLRLEEYLIDSLKAVYDSWEPPAGSSVPSGFARRRAARDLRLITVVTSAKGKIRRSGALADILNEMDVNEVETIRMSNRGQIPNTSAKVEVRLGTTEDRPLLLPAEAAVRVRIAGSDRQWVGGTFDWVSSEIAKDVPWWGILRSRLAGPVIGLLIAFGIGSGVFAGSPTKDRHDGSVVFSFASFVLFVGLMVGLMLIRPLLIWAFPGVEVVEPGTSPRGRQVLAVLVGLVSFAVSVAGLVLAMMAL